MVSSPASEGQPRITPPPLRLFGTPHVVAVAAIVASCKGRTHEQGDGTPHVVAEAAIVARVAAPAVRSATVRRIGSERRPRVAVRTPDSASPFLFQPRPWYIPWLEGPAPASLRGGVAAGPAGKATDTERGMSRTDGKRRCGYPLSALLLSAAMACDKPVVPVDPVPDSLFVAPPTATLTYIGEEMNFGGFVFDQNGERIDTFPEWFTVDTMFFTMDSDPLGATVTAVANGRGRLEARVGRAVGVAIVTVQQAASTMELASGDRQEGIRGEPLAEPLVVFVEDPGETPAAGVAVAFSPEERSGVVGDSIVLTDADGLASTTWTLGDKRMQSVTVSVGDFRGVFKATALSDPPEPDYALTGPPKPARFDPLDSDVVELRTRIANLGDGTGPSTFPVRITVDGVPAGLFRVDAITPGDTATVLLSAGPLEVGRRDIGVEIDPEGEIEEWEESNNSDSVTVNVVRQREIELGQAVPVESSKLNEVFLFRVEIEEARDGALTVQLAGGSGDADLFGHYGERPDYRYRYRCFSVGVGTGEQCQMVPTRVGTYHFAVHAFTAFGPSTLTVTVGDTPVEPFDIELVFLKNGTTAQDDAVGDAAERWESVIARDVFDWDHDAFNRVPAGTCGPGSPAVSDVVDDIRVFVTIDSIDGTGGVKAKSGPCWVRPYPLEGGEGIWLQPTLAALVLDEDDVADIEEDGMLDAFLAHQMAHALGFVPGLWDRHDRLRDPSLPDDPDADPHFDGPLAIAAFDAAGGGGYASAKVPLEGGARVGISDGHWRESVFEHELMTPHLTGDSQPLSLITLESLYDIGYEVHLAEADSFRLSVEGRPAMERGAGPVVDLGNDIATIPIRILRRDPRRAK